MFAFANPIFLYALIGGGVPILIHLIFRRKRTTLKYPTLMFFKRVDMKLASRRKLKEILLLALRALAVMLIALAAARPVLRAGGGGAAGPIDCVLIIDNSASMGLATPTGTRLEVIRSRAASLISALGIEDRAAVITTVSDDSSTEVPSLAGDKERAQAAVRNIVPTHGAGSLSGALTRAKEIFAQSSSSFNRQIFIFSDLHGNLFKDRQALLKAAENWPERPAVFVCPVPASPPQNNLAIVGVSTDPRPKVTGRLMSIAVKVKNNSPRELAAMLTATLGDQPPKTATATLAAGAEQDLPMTLLLGQEGFLTGLVKLGEDEVAHDNSWPFSVEVRGALKALVLTSSDASRPQDNDAFYLIKALDPTGDGRLSGIRVDQSLQQKAPRDVSSYDVVLLCGCTSLPTATLKSIEDYVRRGGGLIIFAGAQDAKLGANHPLQRLLGGKIVGEIKVGAGEKALSLRALKPHAVYFDDTRTEDGRVEFAQAAILQALKIQPDPESEVIAELSTGQPAILIVPREQGRVMWWGLAPHADASNLPLMPFFLSVLHRSVVSLASAQTSTIAQKAGAQLRVDLSARVAKNPSASMPPALTVYDPGGKSFDLAIVGGSFTCQQTAHAGAYRLEPKSTNKAEKAASPLIPPGFVITPDPDEATPEYLAAAEAASAVGFSNASIIDPATDLHALIGLNRSGRELFGYFVAAALLAVLAEVLLANMVAVHMKTGTSGNTANALKAAADFFKQKSVKTTKAAEPALATEDTEKK